MAKKISFKVLDDYSDDFASKISTSFFSTKEKISGLEIINFSEIKQINLFIIKELQAACELEQKKFQSPFFDFSSPAVREVLVRFHNVLSNHISITLENFQPLLKKAVRQTLILVLNPKEYLKRSLEISPNKGISSEDLKIEFKYIAIHKNLMSELMTLLDKQSEKHTSGTEFFAQVDNILKKHNFFPNEFRNHISQFSKILPLKLDNIYDNKLISNKFGTDSHLGKLDFINLEKGQSKKVSKSSISSTLVRNSQSKKQVKNHLTINQKFMFTKILFSGDFELFSATLDKLDELNSLPEAQGYIEKKFPEWSKTSEEYLEFLQILEKRF